MPGWGDFLWGPDPWDGEVVQSTSVKSIFIYWDDDDADLPLGPPICTRGTRFPFPNEPAGHALCWLVPEFMCVEDQNPEFGGTGDWHRLLAVIHDWLFGARNLTGFVDDIASFECIYDIDSAPPNYLDALLLHLGFTIEIPLTDTEKRKVLRLLVELYKQKGTEVGIEQALLILLGIPVEVLPATGVRIVEGFEAGEETSLTLTAVTAASDFVRVSRPERFEVGLTFTMVDQTPPYIDFPDVEILEIIADRVYFDPQAIGGTIEAGAVVWCNRFCDQVGKTGFPDGPCPPEIGPDVLNSQDPALYTFYVDIERTVQTVNDIEDGDDQAELTDLSFIVPGSRVRITDGTAPIQSPVVVSVNSVDRENNLIFFSPISLAETIEAGADAINLYSAEEQELIRRVVEFSKTSHTHFQLTRDFAEDLAEVG